MTLAVSDAATGLAPLDSASVQGVMETSAPPLPEEERLFLLVVSHSRTLAEPSAIAPLLEGAFAVVFARMTRAGRWASLWGHLHYPTFRRVFIDEIGERFLRSRVGLCLRQTDFHQLVATPPEGLPSLLARSEERIVDEAVASGTAFLVREHFADAKRRWVRETAMRILPFLILLGALVFSALAGFSVLEKGKGAGVAERMWAWFDFLRELF